MGEATSQTATEFEREACSRCGGTGRHSYCQTYGDRCFKCHGKGSVLTKRGEAASAYLRALRSKPAGELKAGDKIQYDAMALGGAVVREWFTVREIRPCAANHRPGDVALDTVDRKGEALTIGGIPADKPFRVAQTSDQLRTTAGEALAYQASLTKQGKPRKR